MFLKRIELVGFKSFANKTILALEEGITAVVGPNGCGKSNVVEAVRWVLGEQRPTALRTKSMGDVLFSGSLDTGPVSMAQVTLVLDNTDRPLPMDTEEITVSRRLYRDGESRYLLNKRNCMLRDVKDILYNSGLGAPEYAIMQREMIDILLANKTNERRILIEEAAGIMKYRASIKQALSRLRTSESTVTRLQDIVEERTRHVRRLKTEATKARRLKKYRGEILSVRRKIGAASLQSLRTTTDPLKKDHLRLERQLRRITSSLSSVQAKEEMCRLDIHDVELEINDARSKLAQAREGAASAEKATQLVDMESRERAREKSVLLGELTAARDQLEESSLLHDTAVKETDALLQRVSELDDAYAQQSNEVRLARAEVEQQRQRAATAREEKAVAEHAFRSTALKLEKREVELQYGSRALMQLSEQAEKAEKKKKDAQEKIGELSKRREEILSDIANAKTKAIAMEKRYEKARRITARVRERLKNAAVNRGDLVGRQEVLSHLQQSREGYAEGARFLMRGSHRGVVALLGEELTTTHGFERAVEAALSDAVDYVIVEERNTARELINLLRSSSAGRARIVEYPLLASQDGEPPSSATEDDYPRVAGPLLDVVEVPTRLQPLLKALLGQTLLLEELPSDGDTSRLWEMGWKQLVTREGDVFRADGVHQGGSSRGADLLGRTRQLQDVQDRLARFERAEPVLSARLTRLVEATDKSGLDLAQCSSRLQDLVHGLESVEAAIHTTTNELDEAAATISSVQEQSKKEKESADSVGAAYKTLKQELAKREEDRNRVSLDVEREDNTLRSSLGLLDNAETELERLNEERKRLDSLVAAARADVVRRASEMSYAERRIPELEQRIVALDSASKASNEEVQRLIDQRGLAYKKTETLQQGVEKLQSRREAFLDQLEEMAKHVDEMRTQVDQLSEKKHQVELEIARLDTKEEELLLRAGQELDMGKSELLTLEVSEPIDALEAELERLRERVIRMGEVNPKADDEYQTESASLAELENELSDVTQSRDELLKSIDRANRAAKERFQQTWKEVDVHFNDMFSTLFPGGTARLELVGEGSVLSRGVDLVVTPPEKRTRPVEQLSGGERALTALAFLFALYRVKAGPVCILDEVDAPLDDPNTSRFVDLLDSFSDRIQFFIITHNKHTMTRASKLLGITMENGISRLVPVRIKGTSLER